MAMQEPREEVLNSRRSGESGREPGEKGPYIIGPSRIGSAALLAQDVVIGHPAKSALLESQSFSVSAGAVVGDRCVLRSGTVIYEGATLGSNVRTGHHVVIRENARIGNDCAFGNGAVVRELTKLGRNVHLMDHVVISEGAELGDNIFIGPGVSFTSLRYMTDALVASGELSREQARGLEGRYSDGPSAVVENEVRIGANAVILAGVRLGAHCVVAAGAVVSNDVPAGAMVVGNPARIVRRTPGK